MKYEKLQRRALPSVSLLNLCICSPSLKARTLVCKKRYIKQAAPRLPLIVLGLYFIGYIFFTFYTRTVMYCLQSVWIIINAIFGAVSKYSMWGSPWEKENHFVCRRLSFNFLVLYALILRHFNPSSLPLSYIMLLYQQEFGLERMAPLLTFYHWF